MRTLKGLSVIGLVFVCLAVLVAPRPGLAVAPLFYTYPDMGTPTKSVVLTGYHFGLTELVDIYFDETAVKVAPTDAAGQFNTSITVPRAATPDYHFITVVGRKSGLWAWKEFLVGAEWAQFHFDTWHRGYNPYENVINPANVASLELLLVYATGGALDASPAISYAYSDIYGAWYTCFFASRDGKLYELDFAPDGFIDLIDLPARVPFAASPAVSDKGLNVHVCSTDGKVWRYDRSAPTAALKVLHSLGSAITAAPAVTSSYLVVAAANGKVYKLSKYVANLSVWAAPAVTGGAVNASPTLANGLVYVASGDGKLYAFNNTTGAAVWNVPLCVGIPGLASTPAVSNGLVYVGTPNNKLFARDAVNGAEVWTFLAGGPIYSSPAVANGRVYFGANDGYLYCLDAAYGVQLWKAYTGGKVYSSPTVANGVVYVGSDSRRVFAFNAASGVRLWSAWTNGAIRSSPVVADGMLFVTSWDKRIYIYALDAMGPESQARRAAKRQPPDPRSLVPDPNLKLE